MSVKLLLKSKSTDNKPSLALGLLSVESFSQKDTSHDTVAGEQGSLIGSIDGSVHMQAGNTLHVTGSDIVAAQDVTGMAANVVIDGSQTNRHHDETHESKTTGFSITASAPVIDAAQNTLQQAGASGRSEDSRASALHAMAAASGAYDAAGAAGGAAKDLAAGNIPQGKIELSWGSSSSKSTFTQDSTNNTGSTVKAGGTAAFVATGGNVNIAGSDVSANNVILSAANQVNLTNSTDTDSTRSTNESKSSGVGVSVGTGGFGVDASMSKAHGNANSDSTAANNTHINAANSATIVSGGDTNMIGANVNGKSVSMDVGGNLNIASLQDTMKSAAKQESTGGGFAISQGGGSASVSHSSGSASGNYAGVTEQSGIHAGTDGFAIDVKGRTDLKGAVIASDATSDKNSLTTGTLTFSDIQNQSNYDAKSSGISAGASTGNGGNTYATHGSTSGSNTGGIAPTLSQDDSGNDSAITRSAISAGTINVTDAANQTQNTASLSRDTSNANGTINKTPDLNNLLDKQSDMMSAASAAGEAVARRIGDYAKSKYDEAQTRGDEAGMDAWKEGGSSRAEMQAAGAALVGGLGGGIASAAGSAAGAGLASMSAGQLNELRDSIADSHPTGNSDIDKTLGNIVAGVIATGAGAGVGAGDAGAFAGANVDRFNRTGHDDSPSNANGKTKDLVSQICGAGAQCSDAVIQAAIQAQGMNADAASANLQTMGTYGAPAAALALIGPKAVAAAVLAGGLDYGGSAYSYWTGLSKDKPNFTNSYVAGVVGGLTYPFAIGNTAIAGMGTAGRVAANAYNAGVAGVGAFGTAGMTGNTPDGAAAAATIAAAAGSGAKIIFPGALGNLLNQMIQGAAGPVQNAVQNRFSN